MVRAVKHRDVGVERFEVADCAGEEVVRITNRVVVGIEQHLLVFGIDGHIVVGTEMGELAGIALVVAEMRPVAMEHDEEPFGLAGGDDALHLLEQLHVLPRRTDVEQVLGLPGQFVNHGALRRLVGDEPGLEPGLAEQGRDTLAAIELLVLAGGNGGENHRDALVGRIALGQHVAERDDARRTHQHRGGFAVIPP